MVSVVGVDGCRAGWIAVFESCGQLEYELFGRFAHLLQRLAHAELVLVDIPIGLPWSACPSRPCDVMARRVLGTRRASSVFPAPSRAASRAATLEEARALNLKEVGRSLSAQAWGICAKVAEVDALLQPVPGVRARVREVHPELCFWALNGRQSMVHSKRTHEGRDERLAVLCRHEPRTDALFGKVLREQLRKRVQSDDVLDAVVAYVTAAIGLGSLTALQGEPGHDLSGLPMEMLHV